MSMRRARGASGGGASSFISVDKWYSSNTLRFIADDSVDVEGWSLKHVKLMRDGHDYAGEKWSWRSFLERLHSNLGNKSEGDALAWLEDGTQFIVQHAGEGKLAQRLGLRVCSLRQVLEALNFTCLETHWGYTIYRHDKFILGNPGRIDEILVSSLSHSTEKDMAMPSIAYSSELKPLEVRLSLPDSFSKSWEVTIAPSVMPRPTFDATEGFIIQENVDFGNNAKENSWESVFDSLDEWSDHDMNSPLWWSQHSDFSSICTDDLSDMDTLSQISAYYG